MNWRSYADAEYEGKAYGHKAHEFEAFTSLPRLTTTPLEIAVSGRDVPRARLERSLAIARGRLMTLTFDDYVSYIRSSKGEFTVCKNGFVAMQTGWFSERSAVYLANGRPVVMQDTGFSSHLPCGRGLFAVRDVDEAAEAIARIDSDYVTHATVLARSRRNSSRRGKSSVGCLPSGSRPITADLEQSSPTRCELGEHPTEDFPRREEFLRDLASTVGMRHVIRIDAGDGFSRFVTSRTAKRPRPHGRCSRTPCPA